MARRGRRIAAALALLFASSSAGLLTGSAAATAAAPIIVGSCATSVQGTPGQPVSLRPGAVLGVVTDALPALLAGAANSFAALPPIPVGTVPTGTGHISGAHIANQVVAKLGTIPLLGGVLTVVSGTVRSTLTSVCGITVTGVNAAAAPVQEGAKSVGDTSEEIIGGLLPGTSPDAPAPGKPGTGTPGGTPGGPGSPGGPPPGPNQPVLGGNPQGGDLGRFLWWGRSPMTDYSSIGFARPGLYAPSPGVRYGGSVSGYTPRFGILGADDADGVQAAGHAEALRPAGGNTIAPPVLLAVLALSGVTAALVRTWVLRTAPGA